MVTRGRETQDMGNTGLTLLPPPYTIQRGGRSGGLKGHGDRTGKEASRAAPIPGPTAEQGARAAMADPGTREAMADPGARAAMAEQGARAAMVDPGTREAMADPGAWAASSAGALLPPQKKFLGENRGSIGHLGALGKRRLLGALGKCEHLGALWRHGHS